MEHPFFINGPPTNRSEALRWLTIAEKLLTNRDLVGSKSFATRARDSDPTLSPATDQILGIVDTLIAGEKRINNHHFDYYSILQIPHNQTQNSEFIADQYRRFALLLNPQNNNFPFSDQAFRLIVDAFSVLSNPLRKSMYDKELGFFVNLYPVATAVAPVGNHPAPPQVNYVHQGGYGSVSGSNADQVFVNMSSQDQGVNLSFGRDPHSGISMQSTFMSREQDNVNVSSMASSGIEQQHQQQQQPVTFLGQQQAQPVTASTISFSNADEQPATFLSLNQPQPVSSLRSSLNRENPPFGMGSGSSSSTRGREPPVVSSVEQQQHGNQQPRGREPPVVSSVEQQQHGNQQPRGREPVISSVEQQLHGSQQTRGRDPVVSSVEQQQHGNQQQPPGRNENVNVNVAGNNENEAASASHNNNASNVNEKEGEVDVSDKRTIPSFWTACPYCYIMYEYPLDYADCTLRCQNCKRAFQAVTIASPPPIIDGKEAYFCCWGFMPLGFSSESFDRNRDNGSTWSPFSPMFTCPRAGGGGDGGMNVNNHVVGGQSNVNNLGSFHNNAGGPRSGGGGGRKHSAPRIYVDDDDDVFVEISEQAEESDEDWDRSKERKKAKSGKRKSSGTGTPSKNAKKQQAGKVKNVEGNNGVSVQDGLAAQASSLPSQEGLATQDGVEMSHFVASELSKRGVPSKTRRQPVRVAKHFENLDLNVEFSNEVEERTVRMSQQKELGEEEDGPVEVIGFFEGLDEFLSSLPILNAVDGDRVEAA